LGCLPRSRPLYVDVGSRWRIDFLVIEQEHQVAFEDEKDLFFVVVNVRWGDDLLSSPSPAVSSGAGGGRLPVRDLDPCRKPQLSRVTVTGAAVSCGVR
jgi:hypothetical protein